MLNITAWRFNNFKISHYIIYIMANFIVGLILRVLFNGLSDTIAIISFPFIINSLLWHQHNNLRRNQNPRAQYSLSSIQLLVEILNVVLDRIPNRFGILEIISLLSLLLKQILFSMWMKVNSDHRRWKLQFSSQTFTLTMLTSNPFEFLFQTCLCNMSDKSDCLTYFILKFENSKWMFNLTHYSKSLFVDFFME